MSLGLSEPLLRVRDLRVEFQLARGTLRAVDGVSFDVHPGEALGLVGESGSGKTVALRALVGLLPRTARITGGTVEIDGVDVSSASEARRRELRGTTVSMIFQEPMTALNPVMRVGEQIAETPLVRLGQSRREARQRALEAAERAKQTAQQARTSAAPGTRIRCPSCNSAIGSDDVFCGDCGHKVK